MQRWRRRPSGWPPRCCAPARRHSISSSRHCSACSRQRPVCTACVCRAPPRASGSSPVRCACGARSRSRWRACRRTASECCTHARVSRASWPTHCSPWRCTLTTPRCVAARSRLSRRRWAVCPSASCTACRTPSTCCQRRVPRAPHSRAPASRSRCRRSSVVSPPTGVCAHASHSLSAAATCTAASRHRADSRRSSSRSWPRWNPSPYSCAVQTPQDGARATSNTCSASRTHSSDPVVPPTVVRRASLCLHRPQQDLRPLLLPLLLHHLPLQEASQPHRVFLTGATR
mmetsp:Transcript_2697/g.8459  ORF Transcript_2697/g.8459 Transcript_2697/m.8459 type:complete len:287 (-) Transcript_2697:2026-2886(-)